VTRFKGGHMVWPGLLGHTINPQPMKVRLGDMKQRGATVISDRKGTVKGVRMGLPHLVSRIDGL
jgi:hypothetical protein